MILFTRETLPEKVMFALPGRIQVYHCFRVAPLHPLSQLVNLVFAVTGTYDWKGPGLADAGSLITVVPEWIRQGPQIETWWIDCIAVRDMAGGKIACLSLAEQNTLDRRKAPGRLARNKRCESVARARGQRYETQISQTQCTA
jgi:hypothetical protein